MPIAGRRRGLLACSPATELAGGVDGSSELSRCQGRRSQPLNFCHVSRYRSVLAPARDWANHGGNALASCSVLRASRPPGRAGARLPAWLHMAVLVRFVSPESAPLARSLGAATEKGVCLGLGLAALSAPTTRWWVSANHGIGTVRAAVSPRARVAPRSDSHSLRVCVLPAVFTVTAPTLLRATERGIWHAVLVHRAGWHVMSPSSP